MLVVPRSLTGYAADLVSFVLDRSVFERRSGAVATHLVEALFDGAAPPCFAHDSDTIPQAAAHVLRELAHQVPRAHAPRYQAAFVGRFAGSTFTTAPMLLQMLDAAAQLGVLVQPSSMPLLEALVAAVGDSGLDDLVRPLRSPSPPTGASSRAGCD